MATLTVAACAFVVGCSDDSNDGNNDVPGNTTLGTVDDPEIIDEAPGGSSPINDVTDGSGEGGNRSNDPGANTGTAAP